MRRKVPTVLLRFMTVTILVSFLGLWETLNVLSLLGTKRSHTKMAFVLSSQAILEEDCDILGDMYWPGENLMCVGL